MPVLSLLNNGPMAKSALSSGLGHKEVSGQLNKVIRLLLTNKTIEYTIPEKPNSRLQNYRLTAKDKELLGKWGGEPVDPSSSTAETLVQQKTEKIVNCE